MRADAPGELLHALVFDEALMLCVDSSAVEKLLRYISERNVDRDEFRTRVRRILNPTLKHQAMTLAEQLRQEGSSEEAQTSVIEVLEARFGRVPEGLTEEVRHEKRLVKLRALLREATLCSSIEHFAASLGK